MPKRSSTACGTCKPPVTPGQTTERDFETLAMRPDAGRQSLCAPLEKVITQAVSHARRVTDETLGCTTKPECARPRAQQRENAKRPWKTSTSRCHPALLRPGTGALRCRLSCGPGSIRICRFQLLPPGRTGCFVAAGLSAIALATADVPPAVAGGILPPGPTPGFQPGAQIIQPSRAGVRFSAGRDARLYPG
jgi:hypothetical protein